jgi:hypothetical protein
LDVIPNRAEGLVRNLLFCRCGIEAGSSASLHEPSE